MAAATTTTTTTTTVIAITKKVPVMLMAGPTALLFLRILLWVPHRLRSVTTLVFPLNGHQRNNLFWMICLPRKWTFDIGKREYFTVAMSLSFQLCSTLYIKLTQPKHLCRYSSESSIVRYAKIAMQLKDKTVRDVALRCRWMTKKENGKRRKDEHNSARKNKDKKEKVMDPVPKSHVANRTNGPPYAQSIMSMDSDDGISYKAIGGTTGHLLEQNAQALDQISANFSAFKISENINLFCQARNNILSILNDLKDMPEIMKQMPPLPVKLNEDLAKIILPRAASVPKKS
ncbi:hypothetical protein M9H77_01080 [Catharanthus roseus]|uniref:Uncharacterized protein n=1 Tax=Catharanthus roseus TaxID=4058 RepID=A0ACC0C4I2_CATRO|nr:hypothetical protein M9H77_01080 [Catharanthus roseus]